MLLRGEYTSALRNVQVADMFKEAGIIERYGSGIGRIVDEFKACGLAVLVNSKNINPPKVPHAANFE